MSWGTAAVCWSELFAANGTINTSDAREKTSVRPFTPAELAAGVELGRGIGVYQWLAMVEAKGDSARQHISITVQGAIAILESHGLDPFAYGFICYDQWEDLPEIRDEEGEIVQEHRPGGALQLSHGRAAGVHCQGRGAPAGCCGTEAGRRWPLNEPPQALYAIFDDKRHPFYESSLAA